MQSLSQSRHSFPSPPPAQPPRLPRLVRYSLLGSCSARGPVTERRWRECLGGKEAQQLPGQWMVVQQEMTHGADKPCPKGRAILGSQIHHSAVLLYYVVHRISPPAPRRRSSPSFRPNSWPYAIENSTGSRKRGIFGTRPNCSVPVFCALVWFFSLSGPAIIPANRAKRAQAGASLGTRGEKTKS